VVLADHWRYGQFRFLVVLAGRADREAQVVQVVQELQSRLTPHHHCHAGLDFLGCLAGRAVQVVLVGLVDPE